MSYACLEKKTVKGANGGYLNHELARISVAFARNFFNYFCQVIRVCFLGGGGGGVMLSGYISFMSDKTLFSMLAFVRVCCRCFNSFQKGTEFYLDKMFVHIHHACVVNIITHYIVVLCIIRKAIYYLYDGTETIMSP